MCCVTMGYRWASTRRRVRGSRAARTPAGWRGRLRSTRASRRMSTEIPPARCRWSPSELLLEPRVAGAADREPRTGGPAPGSAATGRAMSASWQRVWERGTNSGMAQNAAIHRVDLNVADLDRHYYADHALTIARHASETDERMMVRLLAFGLHAHEQLTFGRGIGSADEPDLSTPGCSRAAAVAVRRAPPTVAARPVLATASGRPTRTRDHPPPRAP